MSKIIRLIKPNRRRERREQREMREILRDSHDRVRDGNLRGIMVIEVYDDRVVSVIGPHNFNPMHLTGALCRTLLEVIFHINHIGR